MGKIIIAIVVVLFLSLPLACMSLLTDSYGTSKEAENIKYPSDIIHGFIEGCYLAFEDQRFMSDGLWPTDLKEICGCVWMVLEKQYLCMILSRIGMVN